MDTGWIQCGNNYDRIKTNTMNHREGQEITIGEAKR